MARLNQKHIGKVVTPVLGSISLIALLIALGSWFFGWPLRLEVAAAERAPADIVVNRTPLARDTKLTSSFATVVERIAPCVVAVHATRTVERSATPGFGPLDDPFFRRFFGDQFDQNFGQSPRRFRQEGLGSGVIVTEDGYILTNNHVVEDADEVKVTSADKKKEYTAKVVGRDAKTDLAVLKINAQNLPFATLTDSDQLKVGDVVLAVGNPFGVGQTVTMGIISATRRGGMGIGYYEDFIQTDAAINPGNSGGALVDTEGRVIGINTAIISRTGGYQGIGFAVPISLAKSVMDQLIQTGRVVRGYLGVSIQTLTPELARAFEVPGGNGALIGGVSEDSAAAAAGLKSGDVIIAFDGQPIKDSRQLMLLAGGTAPGKKVKVKVLREGDEETFTVTLKQMPDQVRAAGGETETPDASDALEGVAVGDIDRAARRQLDLPRDLAGALITRIDPNSAAYDAGLRVGAVIQEIDRQRVTNAAEALAASKKAGDQQVLLRVWSQGSSRFVVVTNKEAP